MKTAAIALLLFPLACSAQTETAKASTTDCPTWKNKPQVSKAAYFESLRHTKPAKSEPLAMVEKREAPVKKETAEPKVKKQTSTVPSFSSSSDKILEAKKTPAVAAKPVEEKKVQKETLEADLKQEDMVKTKVEKKPAKKKDKSYNSGKVRNTRRNPEKCPAF